MPTLFQINVTANSGSTGRIAEDIGGIAISKGWNSYIAYGRGKPTSQSELIPIGNKWDMYVHGLESRLFDNHGLASCKATKILIKKIEQIKPDIIHLHNIHGYFINYQILFNYLATLRTPILWTLHDCWSFTGHCAHFELIGCNKWQQECHHCPQINEYPRSLFHDRSKQNYNVKKTSFNSVQNMTLIPVSEWLAKLLKKSYLKHFAIHPIYNGIDINTFIPSDTSLLRRNLHLEDKKIILGVANVWTERKGLFDFIKLNELLPADYTIILVGLNEKQIKELPNGIIGIKRTNSIQELAQYYSLANVFVNPTYEDNFPTTNLESLACGTPVITYRTGGSPEAIDDKTGIVIEQHHIDELVNAVVQICQMDKETTYKEECRKRAVTLYDKDKRFEEYFQLYNYLLNIHE